MLRLILIGCLAAALGACGEDGGDPVSPPYRKVVHPNNGAALYLPRTFSVTTTAAEGHWGFRFEYAQYEMVGALLETNSNRLRISLPSGEEATAPATARWVLQELVGRLKKDMARLLPLASPEGQGWALAPVVFGTGTDRQGRTLGYGKYVLEFSPIYRPRSIDLYRFVAFELLGVIWRDYPANEKKYFAPGQNALELVLSVVLFPEERFLGEDGTSSTKLRVSFGVMPQNKNSPAIWRSIDDVLAFKTIGHVKDRLIKTSRKFTVRKLGEPVDILVVLDANGTMGEEAPLVRASLVNLAARLADEATYDYHLGLITNERPELIVWPDGSRYLSAKNSKPDEGMGRVVDTAFEKVGTMYSTRNRLLETALLAVTDPVASNQNAGFLRPGAPRILLTLTDRDDESLALDGSPVVDDTIYIQKFATWMRQFTRWLSVHPAFSECTGPNLQAAAAGARHLTPLVRRMGADWFDLCATTHDDYPQALLDAAQALGSAYRFTQPIPMPLPSLLAVKLGKKVLPPTLADGFEYDVLGDRLMFSPSLVLPEGETITAVFYTLEPPAKKVAK